MGEENASFQIETKFTEQNKTDCKMNSLRSKKCEFTERHSAVAAAGRLHERCGRTTS